MEGIPLPFFGFSGLPFFFARVHVIFQILVRAVSFCSWNPPFTMCKTFHCKYTVGKTGFDVLFQFVIFAKFILLQSPAFWAWGFRAEDPLCLLIFFVFRLINGDQKPFSFLVGLNFCIGLC